MMAGRPRIVAVVPASESADRFDAVQVAVRLAASSGGEVTVIVAGRAPERDATAALALGPHAVWAIAHPDFAEPLDADQLLALVGDTLAAPELRDRTAADLLLVPAGTVEEEVAARLAARLDAVALGRCVAIASSGSGFTAVRAVYGGRVLATVEVDRGPCVAVVRAPAMAEAPPATAAAPPAPPQSDAIRWLRPSATLPPVDHLTRIAAATDRQPPLEGAKVIVAGGRGMGGAEGFAALRELAGALGGAVGGTLPAADAGWLPVSRQIGQSGKHVAPELYVAVGISGTTQHLAGIARTTRIVAINRDPEAPIFDVAEVGAVGDWRQVLPALLEALAT